MKFFNKLFVSALFIMLMVGCQTAQATDPKENPDWLTGTWKGTHQGRYLVKITIRFQYDPATGRISGDADLANTERPVTAKGAITEGKQKDKTNIVFTLEYIGGLADGKTADYVLERKEDGSLEGGGYFNTRRAGWVDLHLKKVN